MANHARIEEVSDSDPEEMDISAIEPARPTNNSIIDPSNIPSRAAVQPPPPAARGPDPEKTKHWQCLYPLYFDSTRTRAEGRRVGKEQAVPNPLAREICDAVFGLGLQLAFEAGKTHPKDWSNPGRVRVLVKEEGKIVSRQVKNSEYMQQFGLLDASSGHLLTLDPEHDLYNKIALHLKANPATEKTPLRLKLAGMPPTTEPLPPPAIPRGWKMSSILPLHSAAVSGGGVSDNLFKDMMAEMQGQGGEPQDGSKSKKGKIKG